jgi:hypothetical protein
MKQILLLIFTICLLCICNPSMALASRIHSPETALVAYLEALKDNNLERAAAIGCWNEKPTALVGAKSWEVKPNGEGKWLVSIDFGKQDPENARSDWNFQVGETTAYRAEMSAWLDTINLWAKRANKLGRAFGLALKEPDPLSPDDFGHISKEPFCVASHVQATKVS